MAAWNPWSELRWRKHIEFTLETLPDRYGGGLYWPEEGWAAIIIDPKLDQVQRNAVLAHELIHDEWGGGACGWPGQPEAWSPMVYRWEERVEQEVARRLVPAAELRAFIDWRAEAHISVTVADVADRFEVPEYIAQRAADNLWRERLAS